MVDSGDLPARTAIPLAFLYTRSRSSVDGSTRFQKLVFLAQKETDLPEEYEFEPNNFGPFSPGLASDLDRLRAMGLVEKREEPNGVGNTRHVYRLTREGIQVASEFADRDARGVIFDSAKNVKDEWGDSRIDTIVRYVYRKYEDYTDETALDTDRLFDSGTRSQFLEAEEEDDEDEYLGPGPGAFKELNPSAEELFPTE
jgi:DNA-binding PadR family transcriptional regulator